MQNQCWFSLVQYIVKSELVGDTMKLINKNLWESGLRYKAVKD